MEDNKKAARLAVNTLVETKNPTLVKLGLAMMPQEDKDKLAKLVENVKWAAGVAKELIKVAPQLNRWFSDEMIEKRITGSWFTFSDAMRNLCALVEGNKAKKVIQFFDTIVLDEEAFSVSMTYLASLSFSLKTWTNERLSNSEIHENIIEGFIERLYSVPHVVGFPDTPETLRAALESVFTQLEK